MNRCQCGRLISHHKHMCLACMWREAQRRAGGCMKIKPMESRVCKNCGKAFLTDHPTKCFCSNDCGNKFYNDRTETRICAVCGKAFDTRVKNETVKCPDCYGKGKKVQARKTKRCAFTPSTDNAPDGPMAKDLWMPDMGSVLIRPQRTGARAAVKINPAKLPAPPREPTRQWTGKTAEERFLESVAKAKAEYSMKAPSERKRRDTCPKGRYTETEDAIILNMRKSGVKIAQIAAATGRSVPAIKQRLGWLAKNATSSNAASSGEVSARSTGA